MISPKPEKREAKPPKRIRRRRLGARNRMPAGLERFRDKVKEADRLWSLIVRGRVWWCQRCKIRPGHDAHHLVSRSYKQTRWLLDNGAHLCRGCHLLVGVDGEENRALAIRLIGAERWDQLNITKHCGAKVDPVMAMVALQTIATGIEFVRGKAI